MNYIKSNNYDINFVKENMMGPNAMKMLEELLKDIKLEPGMRVLDLGCGKGLTSIFLAKEYGVKVFATDLWIGATENFERFDSLGLCDLIVPLHADALDLPYADGYFDAAVIIDSNYYFGTGEDYIDKYLAPLIKKNGLIAIAFPGLYAEIGQDFPKEFPSEWDEAEVRKTLHTLKWWETLFEKSKLITLDTIRKMPEHCFEECWHDWLLTDNEYAAFDRKAFDLGAGELMNFISIIAHKK